MVPEPGRQALKHLFFALLIFGSLAHAGQDQDPVRVTELKRDGAVEVSAENRDPNALRWVWLELEGARNIRADQPLPAGFSLEPLEKRRLFSLRPPDPAQGYSYGLRSRSGEGDPNREPDTTAVYLLPYAHGTKHSVSQGYFGSVTHQGLHALDFEMPEGTPVHAARDGIVIGVKEDATRGGASAAFAKDGNFVEVQHTDGTWAVYAHLKHRGAAVQAGQRVKAGDLLGYSGATGMASGPHLHFVVYRAGWDGPRSVPTVFQASLSGSASLEEGHTYYAYHPGGQAFTPVLGEAMLDADYRAITRPASGGKLSFRQERVDRRTLVWAVNGTAKAVDLKVGFSESQNVKASVDLPYKAQVPAHTEIYLFSVDFIGTGRSGFALSARWRPLP